MSCVVSKACCSFNNLERIVFVCEWECLYAKKHNDQFSGSFCIWNQQYNH